jgi:hypothetical protein
MRHSAFILHRSDRGISLRAAVRDFAQAVSLYGPNMYRSPVSVEQPALLAEAVVL